MSDTAARLQALIDETIGEIEELQKSKFSASEIQLGQDDSGIHGESANGKLDEKEHEYDMDKAEDKETEPGRQPQEEGDIEEDRDKKKKKKEEDSVEKAEGTNSEADPNAGHHKGVAQGDDVKKMEGINREADPNGGHHKGAYQEGMSKSVKEEAEKLFKSMTEDYFSKLEKTIGELAERVNEIAETPVERQSVPSNVEVLHKSGGGYEEEPLSKSQVLEGLLELKKGDPSNKSITDDIMRVEMDMGNGDPSLMKSITNKYDLKK